MIEKASAKINLTLEIVGKKEGYHLLESIVVPINIYDTLIFERSTTDEVVSNINIKDNNIYEAIDLFKTTYNIVEHVKITLDKQIPIGYGLGGSSADISATLRGLNKFFNINAPLKDLEVLANKLGSDTLFCLYNKRSFVYGRGDKITEISKKEDLNFLLILPETHLLTKDVFKAYGLTAKTNYIGFSNKKMSYILENLKNDLTNPALSLSGELKRLFKRLKKNDLNVSLTGSGPALFIVNPTAEEIEKVQKITKNKVKLQITKEI